MTKPRVLSRGPQLDTNKCVDNVGGNRFELVLIAAQRAREIARAHKKSDNPAQIYPSVTALLEIQDGKVGRDYLMKVGK